MAGDLDLKLNVRVASSGDGARAAAEDLARVEQTAVSAQQEIAAAAAAAAEASEAATDEVLALADGLEQAGASAEQSGEASEAAAGGMQVLAEAIREAGTAAGEQSGASAGAAVGLHAMAEAGEQVASSQAVVANGIKRLAEETAQLTQATDQQSDASDRLSGTEDEVARKLREQAEAARKAAEEQKKLRDAIRESGGGFKAFSIALDAANQAASSHLATAAHLKQAAEPILGVSRKILGTTWGVAQSGIGLDAMLGDAAAASGMDYSALSSMAASVAGGSTRSQTDVAAAVGGEHICITDALSVARITADLHAEPIGVLAEGIQVSCFAVKYAGGGRFQAAVVGQDQVMRLYECKILRNQSGIAIRLLQSWTNNGGGILPSGYSGVSIGANTVSAIRCYGLGGVNEFRPALYDLVDGDELDVDGGTPETEDTEYKIPVAICGSLPGAVVIGLNGSQVLHFGVPTTGIDALSDDATWVAAADARRVLWFPASGRVCLWMTGSPSIWIGDPAGHAHTSIPWRRVTLSGPIVDLAECDGMLIGIPASGKSIDCYHLHAVRDPILLTSAPAPGCSVVQPSSQIDAWAAVSEGVLFGQACGYLFATSDLGSRLATCAAIRCTPGSQSVLLASSFGGRALQRADGRLLISGIF